MLQTLVNHNDDIRRLVERGYAIAFDNNHLILRDIPYLDSNGAKCTGIIVSKLEFIDLERVKSVDHQVYFAGSQPHGLDGKPIDLGGGAANIALANSPDVVVQRSFSFKRKKSGNLVDYADHFEKIEMYVNTISGPAMERHEGATPYTYRCTDTSNTTSTATIFKVHDTLTTRSEIGDLAAKLACDVVAVIGLGGTGAYLLDLLVKTPVKQIRAFDGDSFHVHNSFRAPGTLQLQELGKPKAEVYAGRYANFRHGLSVQAKYIDAESVADLEGVTFAFVCVDKGLARAAIFDLLIAMRVPFIDVGMGLNRKHGAINGMIRTSYFSAEHGHETRARGVAPEADAPDDIYKSNIQIAELNSINACLAMIKFKQLRGFYLEKDMLTHVLFEVKDLKIVGE